ncbi:glycoside hydrolase family 36 protein [Kribbella sp. NPDC000426]|uniref:glycoside hydrolase family 36 protein n=1 Tax=Kribbella sp. NPDC000426 TaxID=3154255 RepID=UPI003329AB09
MEVLKDYVLGDTIARYVRSGPDGPVGLVLMPAATVAQAAERSFTVESLVQIKIVGDSYPGGSAGRSLRNGETVGTLRFESQRTEEEADGGVAVVTTLRTHQDCLVEHYLHWQAGGTTLDSFVSVRNEGSAPVTLELLSSFSLTGLTPFGEDDTPGELVLHRLRSAWSGEGRLASDHVENLALEPAWAGWDRCLRFGQVGSWPVHGFFPMAIVEDTRASVCWGAQIAHPASWQIELGRLDSALNLSGGIADRELGHWTKTLAGGEEVRTPVAYLTVTQGGVDDAAHRLTARHQRLLDVPAVEEDLPVIFNEYCTTWGSPSPASLRAIADRLAGKGIQYLVIDSGWYKAEGTEWFNGHGDWELDRRTFPDGLSETLDRVRSAGMIPGIWFEFETVGSRATAFTLTDHLLKRDGVPVTAGGRRFWDFRDPFVIAFLKERVIDFLKDNGFGYLKVDYNNSIGIGCDGAESLGEGLRQQMAAVHDFFRLIRQEMPDLVIENCASGGHRLEPSMLALTSMSSFSDAHECAEIPIIAANVQRAMLPRQNQIWAVLRADDAPQRLVYSLAATMLGRMCLSGDIHELTEEQWTLVSRAISFYRSAAPVIKNGRSDRFGPKVASYRRPEGWQAVRRLSDDGSQILLVAHRFGVADATRIEVPLPPGQYAVSDIYSQENLAVEITDGHLTVDLDEPFSGAALMLAQVR